MNRVALFLLTSAAAFAASGYTVQMIPPPGGFTNFSMSGINSSGQVAGNGYTGGTTQAFLGSPSGSAPIPMPVRATPLPPESFSATYGTGINDLGQVGGWGELGAVERGAFIGTPSGSTVVPLPPGASDTIVFSGSINNSSQLVGYTFVGGVGSQQAFLGTTSGSAWISLPSGWLIAYGAGVNNAGQIAGTLNQFGGNAAAFQAFVGNTSGSTAIPYPAGWTLTRGIALNDLGQVAGYGTTGATAANQAFIGSTSGSSAIPLPPGATTASVSFQSINNSGVVVGFSDSGGWIWDATTGTRLLNSSVPAGWTITNAISISGNGLILAQGSLNGGVSQYVELVPGSVTLTPAPGTWLLLITGIALLALLRKSARV